MSDSQPQTIRREIWENMLRGLAKKPYENVTESSDFIDDSISNDEFFANLKYLHDNGLCDARMTRSLDGFWGWGGAAITTRGLDYLKEDGGLTAQLGVVTVKLDADSIKALICTQVDAAEGDASKKDGIKHAVRALPAEGLKVLTGELVKSGLKNTPDLLHWLGTAFHL
jgi:hypothetical protein